MKHTIRLLDSDKTFVCSEDQHLLQGMQTFRVGQAMLQAIRVGCRGGGCGVCRVRVVDGDYETLRMSCKHISEEEQASGASRELHLCACPGCAAGGR